ncbi:uncharacterized protein LOC113517357 [Galleria mellonella]|uniref:Uncharacterized protein LOC113517357 n=1 Tax=Galleria mellonella TaxID=7137 RepID=A0A6J3C999_GALME|nr:uncharacterized protein LOC113517357 [Galleria mellonella]
MQLVQSRLANKPSVKLTAAVRNASCSRGWLKFVIQCTFGAITVASFILILIMAMQNHKNNHNSIDNTRCSAIKCRIECHDAPYSVDYEDDIIFVSSLSEFDCQGHSLVLNQPMFINETMPSNWMSRVRVDIYNLVVNGGNLRHIRSDAFMSQFGATIVTILFDGVTITTFTADALVGLSSLRELYVKNSNLLHLHQNALRAVDDTLCTLTITESGYWNPYNVTGSGTSVLSKLELVDFSNNIFDNILNKESFTALVNCKILYLNSCKITAIGEGTFDYLTNIHIIYLNNNYLITIPPGLFDRIIEMVRPYPRIYLQDNLWYCDCTMKHLRILNNRDILPVNPVCHSPKEMHGQQFSALENFCNNETQGVVVVEVYESEKSTLIPQNDIIGTPFRDNNYTREVNRNDDLLYYNYSWRLVSPIRQFSCKYETCTIDMFLRSKSRNKEYTSINLSDWIRPMLLLNSTKFSMMQVKLVESDRYGLLWYQSDLPNEVYCVNTMPKLIRIYDINITNRYTFCPINLDSKEVESTKCVDYPLSDYLNNDSLKGISSVTFYIFTVLICLAFGAIFVYGLVRIKPTLLKGSKRLLFVKHKNVEALVLPPKVSLRDSVVHKEFSPVHSESIFFVSSNQSIKNFVRMKSTRSNDSNAPSYISALQPTDDQLAEWRIRHHFDTSFQTMTSISSEFSRFSSLSDDKFDNKSTEFFSDVVYDNLK